MENDEPYKRIDGLGKMAGEWEQSKNKALCATINYNKQTSLGTYLALPTQVSNKVRKDQGSRVAQTLFDAGYSLVYCVHCSVLLLAKRQILNFHL